MCQGKREEEFLFVRTRKNIILFSWVFPNAHSCLPSKEFSVEKISPVFGERWVCGFAFLLSIHLEVSVIKYTNLIANF